jgi:Ca2+-transporting ATPase
MENFENQTGLGLNKVKELQKKHGKNLNSTAQKSTFLKQLVQIGTDPLFLLLILCGLLYFLLGDFQAGSIFLGWTLLVAMSSVFQQYRTQHALAALQQLAPERSHVIRAGVAQQINSEDLVPGDLVLLTEGNRLAADGVLLGSSVLSIDESILSGEALAVQKSENNKQLYSGTLVAKGRGLMRVTAIGKNSNIGKINALLKAETSLERSPIKKQIQKLVRFLLVIALLVCTFITITFTVMRSDFMSAFLNGLAAAMAILPEEFPLVFGLFISLGAWRMTRQKVLTRELGAIEWLGAISVLCTDKTGTLTENNMSVHTYSTEFKNQFVQSLQQKSQAVLNLERCAILATPKRSHDAIEKAIRQQIANHKDLESFELIHEYELTSDCLAMTLVYKNIDNGTEAYCKGAPETILKLCKLTVQETQKQLAQMELMAAQGLRVLGFASAKWTSAPLPNTQHEFPFEFEGFIGFEDPIRTGVQKAVLKCQKAGIRVLMLTGDYPTTALSIAKQAGFLEPIEVVLGNRANFNEALQKAASEPTNSIFARFRPEQKLLLVEALQANGEIVAMTGDGVNDAPALNAADIGISMGKRGCDVAREASALILLDDNFTHIVSAIHLGRNILDKLQKALLYILAIHVPIIGLSILPAIFQSMPVLLMPMHIVLLELLIDPISTLAFESAAAEQDLMEKPPRKPKETFFGPRMLIQSILYGLILLLSVCATLLTATLTHEKATVIRALCYGTLMSANLLLVLVVLSRSKSRWQTLKSSNAIIWIIFGFAILALGLTWSQGYLQKLFAFELPKWPAMLYAFGYAFLASFCLSALKNSFQKKSLNELRLSKSAN